MSKKDELKGDELELSYLCRNCGSTDVTKKGELYICENCQFSTSRKEDWLMECPECGSRNIGEVDDLIECEECGHIASDRKKWLMFEQ